jgi:hypothetical protein
MKKKILIIITVIVAASIAGTILINALLNKDNTSQSMGTLMFQSEVVGVTVTILGPDETLRTGTTGENRQVTFTNLPGGNYRGIASKEGYSPSEIMGISLTAGGFSTVMVNVQPIQPNEPVYANANPGAINVKQGNSGNIQVTVTSQNDYAGTVSVNCYGLPSGVTASLNPASVTLNAGGVGSLTLTLTATSTAAKDTYPISWGVASGQHEGVGLGFLLQVS